MKKPDIIVIGELNVDLILSGLPSLPVMGECALSGDMQFTLGSASAIFASNIAKLGANVGFVGKIGDDELGDFILRRLNAGKVNTSRVIRDAGAKTGICVSMSFPDDYAMVSYAGVRESFTPSDVDMDYTLQARHLHMSSYYLQPGMRKGCVELFHQAKDAGMTTSLDPDSDPSGEWDHSIFDLLEYVDVFLPNEKEALAISKCGNLESALDILDRRVGTVAIKTGRRGVWVRNQKKTVHADAFKIGVVDTTGAGDSFNSGFIYQILRGASLEKCTLWGNACAAISTSRLGGTAGFPTRSELEHFLRKNRIAITIKQDNSRGND